jgi:2-oxoglutarate ferredoxin oxidoreductase subunit alpha
MNDFVNLAFELSFKYLNPAMILSDGVIGQMMEKVELSDFKARWTDEEIKQISGSWATTGKTPDRDRNITTSLELDSLKQELFNHKLQAKYRAMEENDVRFEKIACDDADYLFIAYGSSARICQKAVELAREKGIKVGLLRPITLFPYPVKAIQEMLSTVKGILAVEMSSGQMVEDVRLAVNGKVPVEHFGRNGGIIPTPEEVVEALEQKILGK